MLMIMTRVAAMVIRTTRSPLPGYGESSSLRRWRIQVRGLDEGRRLCAAVAIFNRPESLPRLTHRFETAPVSDSRRALELGTATPDAPSLECVAHPEVRVPNGQSHPDPV